MAKFLKSKVLAAGQTWTSRNGITWLAIAQSDPAVDTTFTITGLAENGTDVNVLTNQTFASPENTTFGSPVTVENVSGSDLNILYRT